MQRVGTATTLVWEAILRVMNKEQERTMYYLSEQTQVAAVCPHPTLQTEVKITESLPASLAVCGY